MKIFWHLKVIQLSSPYYIKVSTYNSLVENKVSLVYNIVEKNIFKLFNEWLQEGMKLCAQIKKIRLKFRISILVITLHKIFREPEDGIESPKMLAQL